MKMGKTLYVTDREAWRAWLEKHYRTEKEVWLIFYKKHTRAPNIALDDAIEEALCFGWIDSLVQRIDDEKYARKFTPRKNSKTWSALNVERLRKLMKEGRMTEAGLVKIDPAVLEGPSSPITKKKEPATPAFMEQALRANKKAWENFTNLAPSYRRNYIGWITAAKKEETRQKRLAQSITLLERNEKPGLK